MARRIALMACMLLALDAAPAMASFCGFYGPGLTRICAHQSLVQQQRYFKKLGAPVPKAAQLRQGLFRGLQASSSTAGARRAGIASGSLGLAPLALIAALALALAGLAARRGLAPRSIP